MRKFTKALAAIMLVLAVGCATGCKKVEDPDNGSNEGGGGNGNGGNGGTPTLTTEGIYLGIIGFNQNQYEKEIGLLNQSTKESFTSFIDRFQMKNLTGLYYADYLALQRMKSCGEPPKLANVALVTFTDGLDNTSISPATPALNPEHYTSQSAYLEALNHKIKYDKVYGDSINAYTIGLKGTDALSNLEEFRHNLHMLASKEANEYLAENMDEVAQHFAEIAESLYSVTATASLKLLLPGGYDDRELRFTFDDSSTPESSSLYIQCKYRNLGTSIRLENITYHGFKNGVTSIESNEVEDGFMRFIFVDLTKNNGDLISDPDKNRLQMYKRTPSGGWGHEEEFDKDSQSQVIPEQKSAIIMLVLDCTTSLGTNSFNRMKEAAKDFVETLVNSSLGLSKPIVTTNSVSSITTASAICGGNVTSDGGATVTAKGVCWSSNQNPTINNHCTSNGTGTGGFTSNITGLASGKTFYVRAYATNSVGTSYGEQRTFSTLEVNKPTVTTSNVSNITPTTATCGGNVTSDGGDAVSSRGVCWSTSQNPTINNSHTSDGTGTGSFTSNITGLSPGTTYYICAYATNSEGTSYGTQRSFTTSVPQAPIGAINGVFSVSASQRVYFSQGNLQYKASNSTWRFATNQYDYIGSANSNISSSYSGWIDLFGWGTSGWSCGNTYYRPWNSDNSDGSLYGPRGNDNLTGSYANSDWGHYNAISNGGNTSNTWRTLTHEEWVYVLNKRSTSSGIRYAKAQVNNVNGVILLPDNWSSSYYTLYSTNQTGASFSSNVISSSIWTNSLQSYGAVFLPAAAYRYGTSVYNVGSIGYYWSASCYGSSGAYYVDFGDGYLSTGNWNYRYYGRSVRLVCPAE